MLPMRFLQIPPDKFEEVSLLKCVKIFLEIAISQMGEGRKKFFLSNIIIFLPRNFISLKY